MLTLITGGVRSGKSRRAAGIAGTGRAWFIATGGRTDREMRARIAAHRRERPAKWGTIEAGSRVLEALARVPKGSTVILDCVTLWVGRMLIDRVPESAMLRRAGERAAIAARRRLKVIAVTNEVGSGVIPPTRLGRAFQDALGGVNRELAARARRVELMVCGLPLRVK
jgi:adenosyl cobinamide kinase/adenosyl cobinamide phosphate guanylyltransferase